MYERGLNRSKHPRTIWVAQDTVRIVLSDLKTGRAAAQQIIAADAVNVAKIRNISVFGARGKARSKVVERR